MNPLICLGLPDAKQKPLNLLSGILAKIEQDEQQLIPTVFELSLSTTDLVPFPTIASHIMPVDIILPCLLKAGY